MKRRGRDNQNYDPGHCFTAVRCEICGEYYEADREHICRKKNSWPFDEDEEDVENEHR